MDSSQYSLKWDVFISYASEDKEEVAKPLAEELSRAGLRVWFDEFSLKIGDSLTFSINQGLAESKYGIVILSPHFLKKDWPQRELQGLFARESIKNKVLLPIWHNLCAKDLLKTYPVLADRFALNTKEGTQKVVESLLRTINLPFGGQSRESISGTWIGESGRLRIFGSESEFYGDYDWNGHEWAGHLRGRLNKRFFIFEWNWDLSPEYGNGFFVHRFPFISMHRSYTDLIRHGLAGGWLLASDNMNILCDNLPEELYYLGRFEFEEKIKEMFPNIRPWCFGNQNMRMM